mmetsp:Transcript_115478/g.331461  ORF Transcript_115478/g.331461 Transcript_115478/m.331461 type:complete len:219 (+) Transcript_115478:1205-1861(+)
MRPATCSSASTPRSKSSRRVSSSAAARLEAYRRSASGAPLWPSRRSVRAALASGWPARWTETRPWPFISTSQTSKPTRCRRTSKAICSSRRRICIRRGASVCASPPSHIGTPTPTWRTSRLASTRRPPLSSWRGSRCTNARTRTPMMCCDGSTGCSSGSSPSSPTTEGTSHLPLTCPRSSPSSRSSCTTCGGRISCRLSARAPTRRRITARSSYGRTP